MLGQMFSATAGGGQGGNREQRQHGFMAQQGCELCHKNHIAKECYIYRPDLAIKQFGNPLPLSYNPGVDERTSRCFIANREHWYAYGTLLQPGATRQQVAPPPAQGQVVSPPSVLQIAPPPNAQQVPQVHVLVMEPAPARPAMQAPPPQAVAVLPALQLQDRYEEAYSDADSEEWDEAQRHSAFVM